MSIPSFYAEALPPAGEEPCESEGPGPLFTFSTSSVQVLPSPSPHTLSLRLLPSHLPSTFSSPPRPLCRSSRCLFVPKGGAEGGAGRSRRGRGEARLGRSLWLSAFEAFEALGWV